MRQPLSRKDNNLIYKCSSDCCSIERRQTNSHGRDSDKRIQKNKSTRQINNKSSQELQYHNQNDYLYVGGGNESRYELSDENESFNLGVETPSNHGEGNEDIANSYSFDETLTTDDVNLSTKLDYDDRRNQYSDDMLFIGPSNNNNNNNNNNDTSCSNSSDISCVYEEPPSHPAS